MTITVSASEFQKRFGLYHDRALREPVAVRKHRRTSVVLISAEEYDRLKRSERRALRAEELPDYLADAIADASIPDEHHYTIDEA